MKIYPAIKARMGDWNYYIVRMKMREVAQEVKLAHDFYEDKTLSDAIQRILDDKRVKTNKTNIVSFLSNRPDRFFSSIVVAAVDGEPSWYPVEMDESVIPKILTASSSLGESFGVLSFGDDPKYYALDGQHRVAAVRHLINGDVAAPPGFDDDMLSVIIVLREEHDVSDGEWLRRYRRLFSSLNRYTKATDNDTNIIMDEDDLFAIITRRLITDYEFFQAPGRERESFKVLTKGKNLKGGTSHFTSLQTLYAINEILLSSHWRDVHGWNTDGGKIDRQIRPEEDRIDQYYEEVANYWTAIFKTFPSLRKPPETMRCHTLPDPNPDEYADHLLFWPIGQELFARLVRSLLDRSFPEESPEEVEEIADALQPLVRIPWEMHGLPWRHLLLVPTDNDTWKMRSEDRKPAVEVSRQLLFWFVKIDSLNSDEIDDLRTEWSNLLYPRPSEREIEEMWEGIKNILPE